MKKIIVLLILIAVVIFGYFAYKSLKNSAGGDLSANGLKSLIENKANETREEMGETTDQAIENAKIQAGDAIKSKIDDALGTKK